MADCETCKWWQPVIGPAGIEDPVEEDALSRQMTPFGSCEMAESDEPGEFTHPGTKAWASAHRDKVCGTWPGELFTMPDFGCGQWQEEG